MIQRPQTLFMLAMALLLLSGVFTPLWKLSVLHGEFTVTTTLSALYLDTSGPTTQAGEKVIVAYIAFFFLAGAALSVYNMLQFKNRILQMKLGALNSLIIAAGVGAAMYWIYQTEQGAGEGARGQFLMGFYLPVAAMVCNLISNRLIRRDHLLVKDSDRLR